MTGPEPLRHGFDAKASAHDIEDTYLPAFRAAVVEGRVKSVICVYNAINGVPGCASEYLLDGTLREQWKFDGYVTGDCDAVRDIETGHKSGEEIDDPAAAELAKLNDEWRRAASDAERTRIWKRMLAIHTEQEFKIGLVADIPQPVVTSRKLRNVPTQGVYNWEPGSFFGIYRPDAFWFSGPSRTSSVN